MVGSMGDGEEPNEPKFHYGNVNQSLDMPTNVGIATFLSDSTNTSPRYKKRDIKSRSNVQVHMLQEMAVQPRETETRHAAA